MILNYNALLHEIIEILEKAQSMVLATSANDIVTARTMSHVNDGLTILFQTGNDSVKAQQIRKNAHIAFAVDNMQIEAVAAECGKPEKNKLFIEKYKAKFPYYYNTYTNLPEEILITATPIKITLYKYIDGNPCKDILHIAKNKAYREYV